MKQPSDFGHNQEKGYAMILLLVFSVMAVTLISAAMNIMLITTQETSQEELSREALGVTEAGIEEALLRILRNPNYTGGTIPIDSTNVSVQVSGTTVKTISAQATVGSVTRVVTAKADFSGPVLTIQSWTVVY
jgi:hypothetical protein